MTDDAYVVVPLTLEQRIERLEKRVDIHKSVLKFLWRTR